MRKTFIQVTILLIITLIALFIIRSLFGGSEDTRICADGQRIRHGNPSASMPTTGCILLSNNTTMGNLKLTAPREHNDLIPARYTCDANDEFPTLTVKNIPENTKTLALIIDDPDAPVGNRDHYLLANIINNSTEITITQDLESESVVGKNSRGRNDRGGPCPPDGTHRYFFKLYALDTSLEITEGFTKTELLQAMEGHIIAQTELIGLYERK